MSRPLLTAEEFMQHDDLEAPVELLRGVVSDLPFPLPRHGQVCVTFGFELANHVFEKSLGYILSNHTCILTERNPDTVRCCDICYISRIKVPSGKLTGYFPPVPPDLIVEVLSPEELWPEVESKVWNFLDAGVTVVCVVDPTTETARIYRSDRDEEQLKNADLVTFEDVLPGFSVPLKQLFE